MSINERKDKTGKIKEVDLHLSAHEQQVLKECRELVAGTESDDLRDATLARFLRHNSWVAEPAVKQMAEYLAWRKAAKVDQILDEPNFPSKEVIRIIVPYAYHGSDRDGRPIYMERTGRIATAALADGAICNFDHFMHSHIYGVEQMMRRMHELSLQRGERVNGICTVLDMDGLGFHHRQCIHILKQCLDFDKKHYPEYLGKLYVINAPWVAPLLYQAVQVFLDEVTKARLQLISGDPTEFLLTHISPENLPKEYGGTCTGEACQHGGLGKGYPGVSGCIDVLDQSHLKAPEVSGLEQQEVLNEWEKELVAPAEGDQFNWYFEVDGKYELDFSVELLPISGVREEDPAKRVLIHKVERLSTGRGSFKAPYKNAKIILRFDNSFGFYGSKQLKYTLECLPADAHTAITGGPQGSASSSKA